MAAVATAINVVMKLLSTMNTPEGSQSSLAKGLEKLKAKLMKIEAALDDTEPDIQNTGWLADLKGVCYDIQEKLDPSLFQYRQESGRITCGMSAKVCFETSHTPFVSPYKMDVYKDMKRRLNMVVEDNQTMKERLASNNHINLSDMIDVKELERMSQEEKSENLERETDKDKIVEVILGKDSDELSRIPIYGKAGLGKTTMAKLIFNDKKLMEHFHVQAWVDVSSDLDLFKVGKLLIESIERSSPLINLWDLENCRMVLKELVSGKRCLIVLEDVWTVTLRKWETLNMMLNSSSMGSIIIVTTCNEEVAKVCSQSDNPQDLVRLMLLSDENCKELFQKRAFKPEDNIGTDDMNRDPTLVNIGNDIARNCNGVPLIANALGTMLSFQKNNNLWSFANSMLEGNRALLIEDSNSFLLKLKYKLMPPYLKPCFAYCSIFPKCYQIDANKLVHHWISLNFIRSTEHDHHKLENIGKDYLNSLVSMSFLHFEDKKNKVVMKNHIYDIAQDVASNHDINPFGKVNDQSTNTSYPYRYVSLNEVEKDFNFDEFVSQNGKVCAIYLSSKFELSLSDKSFSQLLMLRVLDVEGECIQLPKSIKKLKRLHCFSASDLAVFSKIIGAPDKKNANLQNVKFDGAQLEILSQTFSNFQRLQYLKLPKCSNLVTFPQSMFKFENLLHLELNGCSELRKLPDCFGTDLKCLQHLNLSNCVQLVTLNESITKLTTLAYLSLSSCSKLKQLPAGLGKLSGLQHLDLRLCYQLKRLPNSIEFLTELQYLDLCECSQLEKLPKCFDNLRKLQYLDLHECSQLKNLPKDFGNLAELQYLNLSNCNLVALPESISSLKELLSLDISFSVNLINLQYISSLKKLEKLIVFSGQVHKLPSLLVHLTNLKHIFSLDRSPLFSSSMTEIELFTRLESLRLSLDFRVKRRDRTSCNIEGLRCLNMLDGDLTLRGLGNVAKPDDAEKANLKEKHKLRRLELVWDEEQGNHDYETLRSLEPSLKLWNLTISGYGDITLPRWLTHGAYKFHYLKLKNMKALKDIDYNFFRESVHALYLEDMTNLESVSITRMVTTSYLKTVWIENCPHLMRLTLIESVTTLSLKGNFEFLFSSPGYVQSSSVQELEVSNCETLIALPEWFGNFSKLKRLHIKECKYITSLPNSLIRLTNLESLTIMGCSKHFEKRYLNALGKDWRRIANISNIVRNNSRYSQGLLI